MKKIDTAEKAFALKIQALYDIEKQLEKVLPKLAKTATDPELKNGFLSHLKETRGHSVRLEQIFSMLRMKPKKLKCYGVRGIIEDGDWVMKQDVPEALGNAMLAGAARYAEHYEIAGYLGAIEEAKALELESAIALLQDTLAEEKNADEKLATVMKLNLGKAKRESNFEYKGYNNY